MSELPDLPKYKCHKRVSAAKIWNIFEAEHVLNLVWCDGLVGCHQSVTPEWMEKHKPEEGGYFVVYEDGYTSYSPAEVFEAGYSPYKDTAADEVVTAVRNGGDVTNEMIESALQDVMSEPPTVTPEHVESVIVSEHYFTADDGMFGAYRRNNDVYVGSRPTHGSENLALLTFCVLVLRNGFTVTGESYCFDPAKFDAEKGRAYAREKAVDKVFELEAYLLKERLHQGLATSSGKAE